MTTQTNAVRKDRLIQDYVIARDAFKQAKEKAEKAFLATHEVYFNSTKQRVIQIEYRLALEDEAKAQTKRDAAYTALFNALK